MQRFPQFVCKLGQKAGHRVIERLFLELAFPDRVYAPAVRLKRLDVSAVAFHVAVELRRPVLDVFLRGGGVAVGTAVPEAAVHEDAHLLARPGDVGAPRRLPLQPVAAKAGRAQPLAHQKLGFRVLALVALHRLVDGVGRGLGRGNLHDAVGNSAALARVAVVGRAFGSDAFPLATAVAAAGLRALLGPARLGGGHLAPHKLELLAPALGKPLKPP